MSAPPHLPVETAYLMNEWLIQHHLCLLLDGVHNALCYYGEADPLY